MPTTEQRAEWNQHYYANGGREKIRANKRAQVERNYAYANEAKDVPCADCGERFPTVCMDFDHLPGFEKVANISSLVQRPVSLERLVAEIAKCDVVCANCHRIRTADRRERPRQDSNLHVPV